MTTTSFILPILPSRPLNRPSTTPSIKMTKPDIAHALTSVPETPHPTPLPVTGTLPSYLPSGTLYRNGPGRYTALHKDNKPHTIRHWFDGHALLHAFTLDTPSNKVLYRSRFLSPSTLRAINATNLSDYSVYTFASSDPSRSIFAKFTHLFIKPPVDPDTGLPPTSVAPNVTVENIPSIGPLVARTDANSNMPVDPRTLQSSPAFPWSDLSPDLSGDMTAAHGEYDRTTREYFNFIYTIAAPTVQYKVFRISPSGDTKVFATFNHKPCYLHSFSLTENYLILILWPCHLDALRMLLNKDVLSGLSFDKSSETTFLIISRQTGHITKRLSKPFFAFHTVNAFETQSDIHIDLCEYDNIDIIHNFTLENLRTGHMTPDLRLTRYTLPLSDNATHASTAVLADIRIEFPTIHPNFHMKPHRYIYGAQSDDNIFSKVVKVDVQTGHILQWGLERSVVGEPIFLPNHASDTQQEDDGSLLVVVLDAAVQRSMLVVLDARDMKEVASAVVPGVVPLGFHGAFRPAGLD